MPGTQAFSSRLAQQVPGADPPALALKIELAVDEEVATLAGGERCLAVLKADGWRLARTLGISSFGSRPCALLRRPATPLSPILDCLALRRLFQGSH